MSDSYKTFTVVGVSKLNGKFKVRYANNLNRIKVLAKNGHTDIAMIQLPEPTWATDAVHQLLDMEFMIENTEAWDAVREEAARLGFV